MTGNGLFLLLNYFVPPVFQLRGDRFDVSDLNFGLGFDARGVIVTQTLIRHLHFRLGGVFRDAFGIARSSRICKVCKESLADSDTVLVWSRPKRNTTWKAHNPALNNLPANGTGIYRCGCVRQNAAMSFIPGVHARSSTNGRQKVLSVPCLYASRAASRVSGFFISPASSRSSSDAKPVPKIMLPVSLHARQQRCNQDVDILTLPRVGSP
jgi:hypothetical protein